MTDYIYSAEPPKRDYSLVGPETLRAEERGLATAEWYHTAIPRKRMKELMQRSDGPATRDIAIWAAVFFASAIGGFLTWGTWWCVPFFIVYGVLYGSSSDARWHEFGHRTAFRTQWKNDILYQIASFMVLREPEVWRWSHTRHHTDTIIVGRDPEIAAPRPPNLRELALAFLGLPQAKVYFKKVFLHASGRLSDEEKTFIPESEWDKVYRTARIHLAIYAAVILLSLATWSILPLMYVGLPSFYGAWWYLTTGLTQHAGLSEDVLDHRLNCRTVYMNPVARFLYLNMNYHVEHHMFPMVPYYNLPALHEEMKDDTPTPYSGFWEAYKEIIPTLIRQVKEPGYYVKRELPPTAKPFVPAGASPAGVAAE
ncbi:MAG: fatty acid desaturase family protein [Bauldia litoralis]|uniref:fatty acid desaturase family protein n=1 Tax=Bauldia litoralis TaxID=665467 RepID=UPI003296CA11